MRLIAALGNPGKKYEKTRHNMGWIALDDLLDKWGVIQATQKYQGEFFQLKTAHLPGVDFPVWAVKPQTFMNLSGECVGAWTRFHKMDPQSVVVLHDELDLNFGDVKLKRGGGNAGHNGLKSLEAHLGSADFYRIRLGIGHPRALGLPIEVHDYVLGKLQSSEMVGWQESFELVEEATKAFCKDEWLKAATKINARKKE